MKALKKILAKACVIVGALLALPTNAQPWYGQLEYQHDSMILSSAKRTTVTTQGYVLAGFRPKRQAIAGSTVPDFVIDQITADGLFTAGGGFSQGYQFQADAGCNAANYIYRCNGITIVEVKNPLGTEVYAIAGSYGNGAFFATLNNTGGILNQCFWPIPNGSFHKPALCESLINPGNYYVTVDNGSDAYFMNVNWTGAAGPAWELKNARIDPRDLIESPMTGEVIVVGLGQINASTGTNGFFMSIKPTTGVVSIFNNYNINNNADAWFSCIELANSPTSGGPGYVVGGRAFSPTPSNADHTQCMCKIGVGGNMEWSSLIQPGAFIPNTGAGTEVIGVYERLNPNNQTYEYYGVAGSFYAILGGSVVNMNNLVVFKLDDMGGPSLSPNEFHYIDGGFVAPGPVPYADLSAIETGVGGADDGIQVYGTRMATESHYMAKAYFNGVSGCLEEQNQINQIFPGPQLNGSTQILSHPINSCSAFILGTTTSTETTTQHCYTNSLPNGSNARLITGIQALSEAGSQMSLYPNPAKDRVTLTVPAYIKDQISVAIFNNLGQKVQEYNYANTDNGEFVIDFNALGVKGGFYIVQVSAGSLKNNYKIIYEGK